MKIRHAHAARISGNFRVVPLNGESDRRVAEHTEIVAVVRVLRDPLAGKTRYRPKACSKPAWNSLRNPGLNGFVASEEQRSSGLRIAFAHPMLESTRFSLKGDSRVRA